MDYPIHVPKVRFGKREIDIFPFWIVLLLVGLAFGAVGGYQVFRYGLSVTGLNDQVPWGLWIVIDISSIALGGGAFTMGVIVYLLKIKRFENIGRLAVIIGFLGYSTAGMVLLFDLGQPLRFWHPVVFWQPHSLLWEITMCVVLYLTVLVLEMFPSIMEHKLFARFPFLVKIAHFIHKMGPVLAVLGLTLSLLHQASLGATYGVLSGRGLWFRPSDLKKKASVGIVSPGYTSGIPCRKNHSVPKKPLPAPNISPNPSKMKPIVVIVVSIRFSAMMFTTFFERTKPASKKPKPACMKNTRNAATNTHTVSTALTTLSLSCAKVVLAYPNSSAIARATFRIRRIARKLTFIILLQTQKRLSPAAWCRRGRGVVACQTHSVVFPGMPALLPAKTYARIVKQMPPQCKGHFARKSTKLLVQLHQSNPLQPVGYTRVIRNS